ncbi:MAG: 2Fe-2S iron-sulfur cluster binding domain-containing protein, partial [Methylococcales bacterium]|nr:2Fe-2S iron-sulfur cluster binding domain-containing protein [Methylococcales bacterium]
MPRFLLNNDVITTDLTEGTVLLDFLRQEQHLIGTRAACREGDCSSCMVLYGELNPDKHNQGKMKYRAFTSCLLPLGLLEGKHIVTIEGINSTTLNPVQQALVEQGGIQCGFCTPGLVIAITAYFLTASVSEQALMIDAVSGNLCRCTGYAGIKRA